MTVAETILERLDVDPALVGDLLEQRNAGRSSAWLCRQILVAACVQLAGRVSAHPVLVARALAVGGATVWLMRYLLFAPARVASRVFGVTVGNALLEQQHDVLRWAFLHYHLYDVPFVVADCLTVAVAGWVVARTHRRMRGSMVLLFALATELWWAVVLIDHIRIAMLMPRANLFPFMEAISLIAYAPSIVIAGLYSDSRHTPEVRSASDN